MGTKIEWADEVWNPVTGCDPISDGCTNCYAKRMSRRLRGRCGYPRKKPFQVTLHRDKLEAPFHWRKIRRVFVCSMGDLFHKDVPDSFISEVLRVTAFCAQHTFMILTKRPKRMRMYFHHRYNPDCGNHYPPPQNLWLGVSVENQKTAMERIPVLIQTTAAMRFVSCEPMLERIDFGGCIVNNWIDWVICGAETGPGARSMNPEWPREIMLDCKQYKIPFFMKWMPDLHLHQDLLGKEFPERNKT